MLQQIERSVTFILVNRCTYNLQEQLFAQISSSYGVGVLLVAVKILACGANSPGSSPDPATAISEIGYILIPSWEMTEILLKAKLILKTLLNQI